MQTLSRAIVPLFVLVCVLVITFDWLSLTGDARLTRERGSVETLSAVGYFVAAGLYLIHAGKHSFWPVPAIMVFMALREFDADKRFTSEGLLSTKIFLEDTALWEKGLAALVWITLLWTLSALIRRKALPFLAALRRAELWALALSAGIFIAAFSKSIDGLARKLAPMGVTINAEVSANAAFVEEGLELLIPLFFMIAILSKRKAQSA